MDKTWPPDTGVLRDRRGDQRLTFSDITDVEDDRYRRPENPEMIERLATFLSAVELIRHDREVPPGSSITNI